VLFDFDAVVSFMRVLMGILHCQVVRGRDEKSFQRVDGTFVVG